MSLIVQKYGGSSVADAASVKRVAQRIVDTKKQGNEVVVVVSAMGDTTDELIELAEQVSPKPAARELDMLLTAGERISMAVLAMAIRTPAPKQHRPGTIRRGPRLVPRQRPQPWGPRRWRAGTKKPPPNWGRLRRAPISIGYPTK